MKLRRDWILLLLVAGALGSSCPPEELRLLRLDPNLGRYRVDGTEPVVALFTQPVDPASVAPATFFVTAGEGDGAPRVEGHLGVDGPRVIFVPEVPLRFGLRYRVRISSGIRSRRGAAFDGHYPPVRYGNTSVPAPADVFIVTKPNDLDDGSIGPGFDLLGYRPLLPEATDPSVPESVPGISITEAWKLATGRRDVLVAVLDNGLGGYAHPDLREAFYLNRGELPLPRDEGGDLGCKSASCPDPYDFNGDGHFDLRDYAAAGYAVGPGGALEAVKDGNGNGRLDAGDLVLQFSDGADGYAPDPDARDDANGLRDDISGYDFFRDVPQALGMQGFPEGRHGEGRAREAVGAADNGQGGVGACPGCSVMVVRYSFGLLAEGARLGQAVDYAVEMGADVIVAVLGATNATASEVAALERADAAGVPVIVGPGDESSFHHAFPSVLNHTYTVKANLGYFTESQCTGYGAQLDVSAVGLCSSTAAGRLAGTVGLLISRARDLGYCATSSPSDPSCTRPDLGANELMQILRQTAQKPRDLRRCFGLLGDAPCKRVPDLHQGYGRVNAFAALLRLETAPLPPAVQILSPGWFGWFEPDRTPRVEVLARVEAREAVEVLECAWAAGLEPEEDEFVVFDCTLDGAGELEGSLDSEAVAAALGGVRGPPSGPQEHAFTVRVRARAGGALGQDRRVFGMQRDGDLLPGLPLSLLDRDGDGIEEVVAGGPFAPSLESAPALADLDGDGLDELILATSNGQVHVLRYDREAGGMQEAPGWPMVLETGEPPAEGVLGAPAVGDVDGDGGPDVVVATLRGRIFGFRADSSPVAEPDGLLTATDPPDNRTPESFGAGAGFLSGAVLADLNGDEFLDVVAGASDAKVYAVDGASISAGSPARLPGWPVRLRDPAGGCTTIATAVLAPLAAEDLDGDGRAEILAGSSESCDEVSGRLYALRPEGRLHPAGPYLAGFPARIPGNPAGEEIPVPPLTTGVPGGPAAAELSGKRCVGTGTFLGPATLVCMDPVAGEVQIRPLDSGLLVGAGASGAFTRRALREERLEYAVGGITLGPAGPGGFLEPRHRVLTWAVELGRLLRRYAVEDYLFGGNPTFVDLDGDGREELVAASGGHLVHGFRRRKGEPEGWPKFTYGWHMASPAVGDLDGDGFVELVAPVRAGRVFAWRTDGPLCGAHSWRTFRHDNLRTGSLETPIDDPRCGSKPRGRKP